LTAADPNRSMAAVLSIGGLPLIDLIVLLGTGQLQNTDVSLMAFPVAFAVIAWVICRLLDVGRAWGAAYALGCAGACWMAAACAGIFDSMFLPW
jgi:hypothetical protein